MPRVVWCSAHYWQSAVQVSAHQHARELARRGWDVLFLSTPVTPFHAAAVARSADHRARFAAWHRRGRPDAAEERVRGYTPLTLAPLSMVVGLRYDVVLRRWQDATLPPLGRSLRHLGWSSPDLLVVDTPLYGFLLRDADAATSVYRVTDYNPGFLSATSHLGAMERAAVGAADVVLYTAGELEPYVRQLGRHRAALVPHGVDVERFSTPHPVPPEYESLPAPRAVYVGSLREWFDYALLEQAARAAPDMSFIVIGPEHWARKRLPQLPNVHVLGERPHAEVPAYLQHADVGIIPFDRAGAPDLVDAINPLKLYEYAAAGLPVVATRWRALADLNSPALLATTAAEFSGRLREAVQRAPELAVAGREWVSAHTWRARSDDLLHAVGQPGGTAGGASAAPPAS